MGWGAALGGIRFAGGPEIWFSRQQMAQENDQSGAMTGPMQAFLAYWHSLPKTNHIPKLADFFDSVPPTLAPYLAIADVHGPVAARIRLFGTHLVEQASCDPTGMPVAPLYRKHLRATLHKVLWTVVSHPVGYVSHRKIVGRNGFVNVHPSLGLPIDIPTSGLRAVVNYSGALVTGEYLGEDRAHLVQEMEFDRWIDIGAGVPAFA